MNAAGDGHCDTAACAALDDECLRVCAGCVAAKCAERGDVFD